MASQTGLATQAHLGDNRLIGAADLQLALAECWLTQLGEFLAAKDMSPLCAILSTEEAVPGRQPYMESG